MPKSIMIRKLGPGLVHDVTHHLYIWHDCTICNKGVVVRHNTPKHLTVMDNSTRNHGRVCLFSVSLWLNPLSKVYTQYRAGIIAGGLLC